MCSLKFVNEHTIHHGGTVVTADVHHNMVAVFVRVDCVQEEERLTDVLDGILLLSVFVDQVELHVPLAVPAQGGGQRSTLD